MSLSMNMKKSLPNSSHPLYLLIPLQNLQQKNSKRQRLEQLPVGFVNLEDDTTVHLFVSTIIVKTKKENIKRQRFQMCTVLSSLQKMLIQYLTWSVMRKKLHSTLLREGTDPNF